ncbi:MAG: glycosyltransferase family 4 protein [Rubrimonas sp.]|uniref:glycosyltransferase family 4 protein n=1 Tax=Rubrimonas sp. TaxID=2036015 RepID=UPI002FDC9AF6
MSSIAFYAPMKPPDHPTPSGDRRIARLLQRALERAGHDVVLASRLRLREGAGDAAAQTALAAAAEEEADRLIGALRLQRPALWFTYHCYYKAPDLIGPRVAEALGVPYVVAEGTRAAKRLQGPWARFAAASESALDRAAAIFWFTTRDYPALEAARPPAQRLIHLPPFSALGEIAAEPVAQDGPIRLVTVAMMRAPDKLSSYRALAAALALLDDVDWRLTIGGDGPAEAAVRAAFAPFGERVIFAGRKDERPDVHALYAGADLLVWPGHNEAFGMVYLEAQAMGRAAVAENRPGVREVVAPSGALTAPNDPEAFAEAIRRFARDRAALARAGAAARAHMLAHHGIEAAGERLRAALAPLLA